MDKIIIGNVPHDRKALFFFYGSLIAISLQDGTEYATNALTGIGGPLTDADGNFKNIQELENALRDNCLNAINNQKEKEQVRAVFTDLCILYRHFEAEPVLQEYIMYHRSQLPKHLIEDIRRALKGQNQTTAITLLDKIESAYETMSTQEFIRLRNEVYYTVTKFNDTFDCPKP